MCSGERCHTDPVVALVSHAEVGSFIRQNSVELEQVSGCSDSVCTTELTLFFPLIDSLSDNAAAFSKRAKHLRRQMWWRDCKVSKKWNRQGWTCGRVVMVEKLCFLAENMLGGKGLFSGGSSYPWHPV